MLCSKKRSELGPSSKSFMRYFHSLMWQTSTSHNKLGHRLAIAMAHGGSDTKRFCLTKWFQGASQTWLYCMNCHFALLCWCMSILLWTCNWCLPAGVVRFIKVFKSCSLWVQHEIKSSLDCCNTVTYRGVLKWCSWTRPHQVHWAMVNTVTLTEAKSEIW